MDERALTYLEHCFILATTEKDVPSALWNLSPYHYSHHIEGDEVYSGHIAYGSFAQPKALLQAAQPLFQHHDPDQQRTTLLRRYQETYNTAQTPVFCGLGWDLHNAIFSMYFWHRPQGTAESQDTSSLRWLQLSSRQGEDFTLTLHDPQARLDQESKRKQLDKRQIFEVPKHTKPLASRLQQGLHAPYIDESLTAWRKRLPHHAQRILTLYEKKKQPLRTLELHTIGDFVLHYPS